MGIVLASLASGLVAAALLVVVPFGPATESALAGSVLCGFALGWAMLAALSTRWSDEPQRWAVAPALLMGVGGLLLVLLGSAVQPILDWVWPPATLALVVWMVRRIRRRLPDRGARWLLYPVVAALALASIGGGYQTVAAAADAQAHPMPGELIDVGDHRLHLHCTGSGSPTVVLEPGGGAMSSNLGWISPAVARDTRVCVYDRAGRGWSESAPTPRRGSEIAVELHTLLQRGGVPGPYVLAGHSFGGLYAQTFAAHYPDEVAGMVLIDSTAPDATASEAEPSYLLDRAIALASASAQLGLARAYSMTGDAMLPPRSDSEVRASGATARDLRSTIDEYVYAADAIHDAAGLSGLGDRPLIVVTAGSGSDAAWHAAQRRMSTLSSNSDHRVVEGVAHEGLVSERDGAAATARAILDVVAAVRSAEPVRAEIP